MTHTTISVLCAGASQGLFKRCEALFRETLQVQVSGRFGAVGAMKEAFLAGEPCDLMVLTEAMVREMTAGGLLTVSGAAPIGKVRTGIAVPKDRALPDVQTPEALARALSAAQSIWIPDTERSTAGQHFARLTSDLGLADAIKSKLRMFPNGATAMREMAASGEPGAIGCTQISEILFTAGVRLVGPLPKRFELATVYTAAISHRAIYPELSARVIALMVGAAAAHLRADCGFEPV